MEWKINFENNRSIIDNLERKIGNDNFIFFISGSYGDVFPNLALMKEFNNKYNKNIIILISERWKLATLRFQYPFLSYFIIDNNSENILRRAIILTGRPLIRSTGYIFPLLPTLHPWVGEICLSERVTDFEIKRALLGLSIGSKFDIPNLAKNRENEINEILKSSGVKKENSVLLSFSTNSNETTPINIQEAIIKSIIDSGYNPIFNSAKTFGNISLKGDNISKSEIISIDVPCDAPFEVLNNFKSYIGPNHGLTNILFGMKKINTKLACTAYSKDIILNNNGMEINSYSLKPHRQLKDDLKNKENLIPIDEGYEAAYLTTQNFLKG